MTTKTKRLGLFILLATSVITLILSWSTISAKFSFFSKKVGDVKQLKQSDAAADQNINAEVLETVDYKLPFHKLPTNLEYRKPKTMLKGEGIMWNASAALAGSNGGKNTKTGSYIQEIGDRNGKPFILTLGRQDDYSIQQDNLVTFIREYLKSGGKVTDKGSAFAWIMGDNDETYMSQLNRKLKPLEKEFGLREGSLLGVGFVISGWSYGEDKAMGLAEWLKDPQLALGQVFACYPQDGDQNLIIKWAIDNGLLINPDPTTICDSAINFAFTDGFMEAANAWGTMTGERMVVTINRETGKTVKTGKTKSVKILGCGTWTPGDELAFNNAKRDGVDLISLYSTFDNAYQMPCLIITVNKFYDDQPQIIDAVTESIVRFGDQMKVHPEAFNYSMNAMAEVYPAKSADYWGKYFKGIEDKTPSGETVKLGGTRTANLADNLDAFGIGEGSRGTFKSSYETFGGFMHELYPNVLPERLAYFKAVSSTSLERIAAKMKETNELTKPKTAEFEANTVNKISEKVGQRAYKVEFDFGKASLTSAGIEAMQEMFNDLNTHDLIITIRGYTDNVGSDVKNNQLSQARAETVRNWLSQKNAASFPTKRFDEVKGFGSQNPIDDNTTESGRARNRRVEIMVGH